ncbi:site-specific DNA-methyltransferase [Thalassobacillus sp. CUG 92003]|uniref:DNA-methyltransferase n=1 Tax=Thalassobacillus sp. CUG 92003 TaxID=2736641 RepID=UPI0015E62D04|nr:site-specific DNA-methyltransferase [Thalassobacillus sp. CUG 92003]
MNNQKLFSVLNITDNKTLKEFAKRTNIRVPKLRYYNENSIFPHSEDLEKILEEADLSEIEFRIKMGVIDSNILDLISNNSKQISEIIQKDFNNEKEQSHSAFQPKFETKLGKLYQEDSLELIKSLPKQSVDLIFADPPFNLDKNYESKMNDKLSKEEYKKWTEEWILGCIDLLKEGGAFFLWNLPSWNTYSAEVLSKYLNFRHWIAVDIKYSLPIANRLYPAHYSLLYYVKGEKPNTFKQERIPLEICKKCGADIKDYGGYKNKLNPKGLSLPDVWKDVSPVRHKKYKTRDSNQLPVNLLERVISMSSKEGDTVFDPFGGSGTSYIVSEILNRNWIGGEIGPIDSIKERFKDIDFHREQIYKIQSKKNTLFTDEMRQIREKNEHWLPVDEEVDDKDKEEKNSSTQVDIFSIS